MKSALNTFTPFRRIEGKEWLPNFEVIKLAHDIDAAMQNPALPKIEGYVSVFLKGSWTKDYARKEAVGRVHVSDLDLGILIVGDSSKEHSENTTEEKKRRCQERIQATISEFEDRMKVPVELGYTVVDMAYVDGLLKELYPPAKEFGPAKRQYWLRFTAKALLRVFSYRHTGQAILGARRQFKEILEKYPEDFRRNFIEEAAETAANSDAGSFGKRDAVLAEVNKDSPEYQPPRFSPIMDRWRARTFSGEEAKDLKRRNAEYQRQEKFIAARTQVWSKRLNELWLKPEKRSKEKEEL